MVFYLTFLRIDGDFFGILTIANFVLVAFALGLNRLEICFHRKKGH